SIHGFTGAAFHQQCDQRGPTVSVGYNASGYVFGGYTQQPFTQSGQYVHDDQAFLFTFRGERLLKYPVTGPANAVRMIANSGPYFGEALVLVNGSKAVVYSNPGSYYNFNAAEMHGNDLNLTECEVYEVEGEFTIICHILTLMLCFDKSTRVEESFCVGPRKGIPQLVLLTKVDEACPLVKEDVKNIYKSGYIKEIMQEVSAQLGVPVSCVVPVKNYCEELELDLSCDVLLLSAVMQMLRFADNYFDEISDQLSNTEVKE
uniref:uncharacterized protein LOC117250937 n=1 Tax=Epinephelus lanceolatus TaxID=310571 RepID=UPI0014486319